MQKTFFIFTMVILVWFVRVQNTIAQTKLYDLSRDGLSVDFSPDGKYIVTGDVGGDVALWEVSNGKNIYHHSSDGVEVRGVNFSHDGKYIAYGGSIGIILLNADTGRWDSQLFNSRGSKINSLACNPNALHTATGYNTGWVTLLNWDRGQWSSKQVPETDEIYAVTFSPDGKYLAIGDSNGYASIVEWDRLWVNWWENANVQRIKLGGNVRAVAFSPNGQYLAADEYDDEGNESVYIYDVVKDKVVRQIDQGYTTGLGITALAFSPDGKFIAVGNVDSEIKIYRIGTEMITSVTAINHAMTIQASGAVEDLAWSLDSDLISDGRAVWRTELSVSAVSDNNPRIRLTLPDDLITEEAFGTNATYFIVKAKYPMLTGVSAANILYGSCIITLHIPDGIQGFVFPIQTKEEEVQDASVDIMLSLGSELIPLSGILMTLVDVLDLFSKVNDLKNRDLKIEFHTSPQHRKPPETEVEFIVLLKHPVNRRPNGIDITIEQQYRDTDRGSTRIDKVNEKKRWIFDDGWAAPTAQVTVFDYPPFQLLPAEVQNYLLLQFSEFGTTKSGLMPKETALLPNYPNPLNPETWLPYQLAKSADVTLTIYAVNGHVVRELALGHQAAGVYQRKSRAAYWDGRNAVGEPVASGVYFYTLTAGDFTATRKMLIRK